VRDRNVPSGSSVSRLIGIRETSQVRDGKREGRQEGERKGKLEDARNALKEGLSMEQVARITGIPVDKLQKHLAGVNVLPVN
jgi:predicted transposase/invertase (TIGR01784 family)